MKIAALDYGVIALYLLLMVGIGLLITSKIRCFKDYFLAGGTLTTPLLVCTLVSTYYELDVTFATSERGFYNGLVAWFWWSRPYYVAIFIAAFLVVKKLKNRSFLSLPDVLDHHYGKWTRVTGALACFVYSLPITALTGMATMFETIGWPREAGLIASVGVCGVYTLMGGLWADAITDTVQFLLMCVSLAIAIPVALQWVGGFDFIERLPAAHLTQTGGVSSWLIAAWCVSALTVFVEPAFYQRIFAAKDHKTVTRSLIIGLFLWAAYDWGVTLIGMIARAAVEMNLLPQDFDGKQSIIAVCLTTLPVGLKGLFLAGILAAAMSSVDSYSLLASGNLVYDIYRPLFRPTLNDRKLIRFTRIGIFVVMGIGVFASLAFDRISDAWVFMASVATSVLFVPIMGAIFGRPKRISGLAASLGGLTALILFYLLIYANGHYHEEEESYVWRFGRLEIWREYAALFALPFSLAGFILGNLLGKKRWTSPPG